MEDYAPRSFNTAGPGYLAYIPGGGIPPRRIGRFVIERPESIRRSLCSRATSRPPRDHRLGIGSDELMGYPNGARGVFTSGGSMANFSAVVCARHRQLGESFLDGVLYTSDQVHHSIQKAALLAGFPAHRVRSLPTTAEGRLQVAPIREAIRHDREQGLRPAMIVASGGTSEHRSCRPTG